MFDDIRREAESLSHSEFDKEGKIITFYSYKGGVGRTRSLANVAYQLANRKKRVLCIDFDLEAPDLIRYFLKWVDNDNEPSSWKGVLDLFIDYKKFALSRNPNAQLPAWDSYIEKIQIGSSVSNIASFDYMGPGKQSDYYRSNLSSFDWDFFYKKIHGGRFIEHLKKEFCKKYDYILIDSRTGLADTAGICTIHLPHALVAVFTPSPKGYDLLDNVIISVRKQHRKYYGSDGTDLSIIPLPTKLDFSERDLHSKWIQQMNKGFASTCMKDIFGENADLMVNISRVELMHLPWCIYSDELESDMEHNTEIVTSNSFKYKNLIGLIDASTSKEKNAK